ncbi:MAG: biopolymer transporter ExbD [candidate division KSB1 bacterium]|nr:biopolymer transporter ExbD [candidate division KSB1 bacterium]
MDIERDSTLKLATGTKRLGRGTFGLRLTSMIDMFTILLVFLLKSYSAEGQIMTITPDLRLPESTSQQAPTTMSVIAITQEWILVDGRPLQRLDAVLSGEELVLSSLQDELLRLREMTEGIGKMSANMQGFRGSIAIQGDRNITFDLLKRIMLTCGRVGYNNMHLAVLEKE